jgi:hypothetical protein
LVAECRECCSAEADDSNVSPLTKKKRQKKRKEKKKEKRKEKKSK